MPIKTTSKWLPRAWYRYFFHQNIWSYIILPLELLHNFLGVLCLSCQVYFYYYYSKDGPFKPVIAALANCNILTRYFDKDGSKWLPKNLWICVNLLRLQRLVESRIFGSAGSSIYPSFYNPWMNYIIQGFITLGWIISSKVLFIQGFTTIGWIAVLGFFHVNMATSEGGGGLKGMCTSFNFQQV